MNKEISLNELKPGQNGKIVSLWGEGAVHKRLLDMGLVKGAEIIVERVAPLGEPIEVKIKGYNLSLRKEEARNVKIKVV